MLFEGLKGHGAAVVPFTGGSEEWSSDQYFRYRGSETSLPTKRDICLAKLVKQLKNSRQQGEELRSLIPAEQQLKDCGQSHLDLEGFVDGGEVISKFEDDFPMWNQTIENHRVTVVAGNGSKKELIEHMVNHLESLCSRRVYWIVGSEFQDFRHLQSRLPPNVVGKDAVAAISQFLVESYPHSLILVESADCQPAIPLMCNLVVPLIKSSPPQFKFIFTMDHIYWEGQLELWGLQDAAYIMADTLVDYRREVVASLNHRKDRKVLELHLGLSDSAASSHESASSTSSDDDPSSGVVVEVEAPFLVKSTRPIDRWLEWTVASNSADRLRRILDCLRTIQQVGECDSQGPRIVVQTSKIQELTNRNADAFDKMKEYGLVDVRLRSGRVCYFSCSSQELEKTINYLTNYLV